MLEHKYKDEKDMKSYLITDSVEEAVEYIEKSRFNNNNIQLRRSNDEK